MNESIKNKALSGIFWSLLEKFGVYGVKITMGIILARLLEPEDYGLIGMILVFFVVGQAFIEGGFRQAYIQKRNVKEEDASTIFYFNLFLSLFFYGLFFVISPIVSVFYEEPRLELLIKVMGLIVVIRSMSIIQDAQLVKALNFKKRTKIYTTSALLSGIIGITAAYLEAGVWSLVLQYMSEAFFILIILWLSSKRIRLRKFSFASLRSMFSFGSWMLLQAVLAKFFENFYQIIIGKFFSVAQVGFYTKSRELEKVPSVQLSTAIGNVAFSVISKIQDDKKKIKEATKKLFSNMTFIILPIMTILIVVSKPIVLVLLKEKWLPMIPFFKLLCISSIIYPINLISTYVFWGMGKSKLNFYIALTNFSLKIINVFITYSYGIEAIIIGEILVRILVFLLKGVYLKRIIKLNLFSQLSIIYKYFLFGFILFMLGTYISNQIYNIYANLFGNILILSVVYLLLNYFFNRVQLREFSDNIKTIILGK